MGRGGQWTGTRRGSGAGSGPLGLLLTLGAIGVLVLFAWLRGSPEPRVRAAPLVPDHASEERGRAPVRLLASELPPVEPRQALPPSRPARTPRAIPAATPRPAEPRPVTDADIARWVRDLRDDDVRWNALRATRKLRALGERARPALRSALRSTDGQQRLYAARLLMSAGDPPTPELVRVALEALRNDGYSHGGDLFHRSTATSAMNWLLSRSDDERRDFEPAVRRGLSTGDAQQRFLCAFLLAERGCTTALGTVAPLLVERLRDNDVPCDGLLATYALSRLGPACRPYLSGYERTTDGQLRALLALVRLDLEGATDEAARRKLHRVARSFQSGERLKPWRLSGRFHQFEDRLGRLRVPESTPQASER